MERERDIQSEGEDTEREKKKNVGPFSHTRGETSVPIINNQ